MNRMVSGVGIVLAAWVFVNLANGQDERKAAEKAERKAPQKQTIIVPAEGVTKFTVPARSTLFRLTASTPSGGTIEDPVINGKARLVRTATIQTATEGGQPLGSLVKEFVFRGMAAGEVSVAIKKTAPGQPMPVQVEYTITIK